MSTDPTTTDLELRKLAIEERRVALAEREAENARRAARSPDELGLDLELRVATALADSPFLPDAIKGREGRIAAGLGVVRYARLLGVDPYVLAQQIYVVHGRVGFSTSFLIGLVNQRAGLRGNIDWAASGAGESLSVTAFAATATGEEVRATVTMAQARSWGWASKSDPWKADPELMLRYRSALKLIRLYFGATILGLSSVEELRDGRDVIEGEAESARPLKSLPTPPALDDEPIPAREQAPAELPAK